MKLQKPAAFLLGALLLGCNANPFPTQGVITTDKPVEQRPVAAPIGLIFSQQEPEFVEGKPGEVSFQAWVPAPGTPVIHATGLPKGAVLDLKKSKITWTPDYDQGNDPGFAGGVKTYTVQFTVTSTDVQDHSSTTRSCTLIVHDAPRPLAVQAPAGTQTLTENQPYQETVALSSPDFPQGPFTLYAVGLPEGVTIAPDSNDPSQFTLSYTPNYSDVTLTDHDTDNYSALTRTFHGELIAIAPNGLRSDAPIDWKIQDVRIAPTLSVPSQVSQGPEVHFAVTAEDMNGEQPPSIKVDTPEFGHVAIDWYSSRPKSRTVRNPRFDAMIDWTEIPPEKVGTTTNLVVHACVPGIFYGEDSCTDSTVQVTIANTAHQPPVFDRTSWQLGQARYVRVGGSISVELPIHDADDPYADLQVKVLPDSMASQVSWSGDRLTVQGTDAGFKQFDVVATSRYGVVAKESFAIDVLPSAWSNVLILGDSQKDPEVVANLKLFPSAQIANAALQPLDEKMLALRTTLVAGTSAISDPTALAALTAASAEVKNLVILSPLAGELKGSLGDELANLGIGFFGRFAGNATLPALSSFRIEPAGGSSLEAPQSEIHLRQSLSPESANPLLVTLGSNSRCSTALVLKSNGFPADLADTLSCTRSNGGTLILSGTEWGDFDLQAEDAGLPSQWMRKLVNE